MRQRSFFHPIAKPASITRKNRSLLGLINPIYNESSCYPCHPKTTNVLGVLDTTISLEDFEKERAQIYNRMIDLRNRQCRRPQFFIESSAHPICEPTH